ncbi:MAG: molybdopterin-dependent oxidoreductase [Candidatus Thorarchaeota archaeon]
MVDKRVTTVCPRDCYDSCNLIAEYPQGRSDPILKGNAEHPITQGFLCPRGVKDFNRAYSSQRVLFPYIREKQQLENKGRKCNWNEALELITKNLKTVLKEEGSEAVLHLEYAGNMGLLTWYFPQRIWYAVGATKTDYSICSKSGHEALSLHYGSSYGIKPEQLTHQKLIIFWGFNAVVSSPHLWSLAQKARNQNKSIIAVIDPRISKTAELADIHLQPKPGYDTALAYGIAHALSNQGLIDIEFIDKWTKGFESFSQEFKKWHKGRVERYTGLNWSQIEELATLYGTQRPNVIMIGLGMQKSRNGAEAVRAIGLLPPLIGQHRGFFYSNGRANYVDFDYLTGKTLSVKPHKLVSQVQLGRLVENGKFKFIFIYNTNPTLTLPNQTAFRYGLLREDVFVVVHETHWTETTKYADVVLPALTYLEKDDLVIPWSHHYIQRSNQILKPQEMSRTEIWVMQQLARRLDLKEQWLFQDSWDAIKKSLTNSVSQRAFDDLRDGKRLQLRTKELNEYPTPSGKIEFASSIALEQNASPLPTQPDVGHDPDKLVLLNSALPNYTHTQFQDIYGDIPAIVKIHPKTATEYDIHDEDIIELVNEQGTIKVSAQITESVLPETLWSPRQFIGLGGNPQNSLTPDSPQPIGGGSVFNSTYVKLQKRK